MGNSCGYLNPSWSLVESKYPRESFISGLRKQVFAQKHFFVRVGKSALSERFFSSRYCDVEFDLCSSFDLDNYLEYGLGFLNPRFRVTLNEHFRIY